MPLTCNETKLLNETKLFYFTAHSNTQIISYIINIVLFTQTLLYFVLQVSRMIFTYLGKEFSISFQSSFD